MEINIRLAGVQLGPYSEKQIREYLTEGLVSPADLACEAGTDNWIVVTDLLAQIPADESEPKAPPAMADAVFEDPEPILAPPVTETKRAPAPAEGVTHLPTRVSDSEPQNVEAQAKRTLLLGPTPPSLRPAMGTSAAKTATTTPLANQGTKKITRSSVVRATGSNTAPLPTQFIPTTPVRAPSPATTPAETPTETLPEPKKSLMPAVLKSLTAKTVPMRSAPPLPPGSGSTMPITSPLPTRAILQPQPGSRPPEPPAPASLAPPTVFEVVTKKMPHVEEAEARKSSPEPTEPAAAQKPPAQKLSFLSSRKKAAEEKDKSKEETTPDLVPVTDDPTRETTPPAKKRIPGLIYGCACLAVLLAYYVWSPYHTAAAMRDALSTGAVGPLNATVDFDSVRASLKDQIKDKALTASQDAKTNAAAIDTLNHSIDLYVTPATISSLAAKTTASFPKEDVAQSISPEVAGDLLRAFNSQPVRSSGLSSITDFVLKTDLAMYHLQFRGLEWKLKRIELRPDLSGPATATAPSPLVVPVINTYLQRGTEHVGLSAWDAAIADYSQVLAIDPNSTIALNARADAREAKGDLDGAIKDYTQALTINPQNAQALNGRGNAKVAKNDIDGGITDFTQAVTIDPMMAVAYDARGNAKTAKDDLDGAIADFSTAIGLDPKLASAFSDRGFARQANGNLDGAIADYTQALALKPKTAVAYYNRGLARQSQGNLEAAIIDYDRALAFDPKIAGAYYNRGNAKNALHDIDGAIADYTQAVTLNPKIALAYCNRGLALQSKGDLDGAIADYTKALAIDSKNAVAYYNRGLIKEQKNDLDGAIADDSQALDLDPKNAQAYFNRGFAKLAKGNLDGAQADLKQFCDIAPRDRYTDDARLYLWLIGKAQSTKFDADQDLTNALENSWNSGPDALSTKSASFFLGRISENEFINSANSTDPKTDQGQHCQVYYFAGMHRLLIGDKPAAIDFFRKCIATGQKTYCQYILAQAQLQGLQPPPVPIPAVPAPAKMP